MSRSREDLYRHARAIGEASRSRTDVIADVTSMMRQGLVDDAALLAERYALTDAELNS